MSQNTGNLSANAEKCKKKKGKRAKTDCSWQNLITKIKSTDHFKIIC